MNSNYLSPQVPIMNGNIRSCERETILSDLLKIGVSCFWIAWERNTLFLRDRKEELCSLKENVEYFRKAGLEVGVWIQAYGFGDPISYEDCSWTRLRSVTGKEREADAFCPEDPEFLAAYCSWVKDVASVSPDRIMLDDDLCLSVRPGIGCFCPRHLAIMEEKLGEKLSLDRCAELMFTGGRNPYRDAWYQAAGDSNRKFCKAVREAVDEVDPSIRVGLCAGYTSWDVEGTDPIELSRILAGKTRPFFRFTGAPYWATRISNRFPGQRLNGVIECARNQASWCKDVDVEAFAEADSFPRPCYHVNASYIENFDLAMHAEGVPSLKYLLDYCSTHAYEKQYLRLHQRNMPHYPVIRKAFSEGGTPCGVRLYRPAHRILDANLPPRFELEKSVMRTFFSVGASALTRMSIPVCYDGASDCALLFGDDAQYLKDPREHKKIILDFPAAVLLQQNGVDLGIEAATAVSLPALEYFGEERIRLGGVGMGALFSSADAFFRVFLNHKARVESWVDVDGQRVPSSYCIEDQGVSYLVLCFDALCVGEASSLLCSYARQNSFLSFLDSPYPVIRDRSQIYALCSRNEKGDTVLFENLSIDPYFDFTVDLPKECRSFTLLGGTGELTEDRRQICITSDFHPSSFLLLQVSYA